MENRYADNNRHIQGFARVDDFKQRAFRRFDKCGLKKQVAAGISRQPKLRKNQKLYLCLSGLLH